MLSKDGKVLDRRELLRVKVKSLAAEAGIIRLEERRTRGVLRDELRNHRIGPLRHEARLSHVAYALIRGRDLAALEGRCRPENALTDPHWKAINAMVKRYGPLAPPLKQGTVLETGQICANNGGKPSQPAMIAVQVELRVLDTVGVVSAQSG